jgi:hypothetical protein
MLHHIAGGRRARTCHVGAAKVLVNGKFPLSAIGATASCLCLSRLPVASCSAPARVQNSRSRWESGSVIETALNAEKCRFKALMMPGWWLGVEKSVWARWQGNWLLTSTNAGRLQRSGETVPFYIGGC